MRKTAWILAPFFAVYLLSCGGGKTEGNGSENGVAKTDSVPVMRCDGVKDPSIVYATDTIENDVVLTYPEEAGYELSGSETAEGAYELYGEWDKDAHDVVEFFFIGSPKVEGLDELQHLDNEIQAAQSQSGFALHERGKLENVLYSRHYAYVSMVKNDREYGGVMLLHFDPQLRNYYFVMIQSSDLENYRKDICIFMPFIQNLTFLKKG